MYEKKLDVEIRCPLEYGLNVFSGKWKSRVIYLLATQKSVRYNTLRKEIANITDAVLAATLKEMIADGVVERKQFNEIPPRVEYSLTEKGLSAFPALLMLCQWAAQYVETDEDHVFPQCDYCDQDCSLNKDRGCDDQKTDSDQAL